MTGDITVLLFRKLNGWITETCGSKICNLVKMVITSLAGSHVLLALSLYIIGNRSTQFPEYSVVIMLDDIKLFYYSNTSKLIYRNYKSDHKGQEQEDATYLFGHDYNSLRNRALSARKHINVTHGM